LFQPRLNTIEEWTLINPTGEDHPFHLHTNPQQVAAGPVDPNKGGLPLFTDIENVPAKQRVVIRIEFKRFLGELVYHCHRVDHEDMGMMALVNILPEKPTYAVGANAGQAPQVQVFDPVTGEQVSRFLAFAPPAAPARDTAGVFDPSTATWYLRDSNSPGAPNIPPF